MKTRIKIKSEYYSGNRKSWFKLVTGVDETKSNGYAFDGEFIEIGRETDIEIGSIVIECQPTGSVKNWGKKGIVHKVVDGGLEQVSDEFNYMKDFLSFRDAVAEALSESGSNDLETLRAERAELMARIAKIDEILNR